MLCSHCHSYTVTDDEERKAKKEMKMKEEMNENKFYT